MADTSSENKSTTPFIDKSTAMEAYTESKNWLRPYFEPLDEFERIARNKPSSRIDPALPRVTDGTTASIVQETPKRVIQQAPTGLVTSKSHPEYAKLADIVLRDELIPNYNRMGNMLQKSWNMVGKSMTWGRATSYTFFTNTNGKLHTDFVIPYAKDLGTEKGKVYAPDSNVRWMRSWLQGSDIRHIIRQENAFKAKNPNYKSDWDLKLLAKLVDSSPTAKPADSQTASEREKGGDSGGYEIIHIFQNGLNAESYSFSPNFEEGKPLRVKVSKDPRGLMPFDDLYCNIDLSNPMGRGSVELSGGVQNLIDQQMQMFQFMTTLEMAPPMKVYGNVDKSRLKLRPNALWDMGSNPNNNVEPFAISNFALQNFVGNMQSLQSKIMQLNSSADTSIGAENGNSGQSKTQAGVQATQAKLGVSDNYFRKQYEEWFEDQSETSINVNFAEMTGDYTIDLEKNDLKEIAKTEAAQFLTPDGKLKVPYKQINNEVFRFSVNAGTSEVKEDAENVEKLIQTLEMAKATPNPEIQEKVGGLFKLIVREIGAEGVDDLFPEDQMDENGQPIEQQAQQPQMTPEMVQQMVLETVQMALQEEKANKPEPDPQMELIKALGIKFENIPEGARQQVLESLGFDTGEMTPVEQKQALEQLSALNQADDHERAPELAQQDRDFQASQADRQAERQAEQQAQQAAQQPQEAPQPAQEAQMMPDPTMSPEELELVEVLTMRGFSEDDIEQAIMMIRQGMPIEEVIPTIGAKYA